MPKWFLLIPLVVILSGVLGQVFVNLGFLIIANSIFYYALFKLADWSTTLTLYYPILHSPTLSIEWLPLLKSNSLDAYVFHFTWYSTVFITFWGGLFFNWAYFNEGSRHGLNLFFSQFLVWFSAPTAFISMNWVYYNRLPSWPDIIALCFYAAGTAFRYYFTR